MLGIWYPEFVHLHVFMGINDTINKIKKIQNTTFVLNFTLFYKNIAYKNIQPETCFGKL